MRRVAHVWVLTMVFAAACTDENPAYEGDDGRSETTTDPTTTQGSNGPSANSRGEPPTDGHDPSGTGSDSASEDSGPETDSEGNACVGDGGCPAGTQCIPLNNNTVACDCRDGWRPVEDGSCVAPTLEPMRVELRCQADSCPGFDDACPMERETTEVIFEADPQRLYQVTLRVRGVLEQGRFTGGEDLGWYYEGGTLNDNRRNAFRLSVDDPPQHFFLNAGEVMQGCAALDQTLTVELRGEARLLAAADPVDECGFKNTDIMIPEVPPLGAPFYGQFIQIDLVEASPL